MGFSRLTHMPHQEAQREQARAQKLARLGDPETFDCAACGLIGGGCFGFGRIRGVSPGLFACARVDCRAEIERRVYGAPSQERAA